IVRAEIELQERAEVRESIPVFNDIR
ncbi:hypothetical protein P8807_23010, partial [Bacillus subtilis]